MLLGENITKRLVDRLIMDLRISTNPHLEGREATKFVEELLDRRRAIWGVDDRATSLDKEALEMIKRQLKNNSKSIKVK